MSRLFDDDDDDDNNNFLGSNLNASNDDFFLSGRSIGMNDNEDEDFLKDKNENKKRQSLSSRVDISSSNKRPSINPKPKASQSLESSVFEPIQDLPRLDLFNYTISSQEPSERFESFFAMYQFLAAQPDLCNMTSFVKYDEHTKILDKTVYLTTLNDERLNRVAVKLCKVMREPIWYDYFGKIVLENGFPHFPLIAKHVLCDICTYQTDNQVKKVDNCILIFSEKADGDANKEFARLLYTDDVSLDDDHLKSYVCQIVFACLQLEILNVSHQDLHLKNILFFDEPHHAGKYLHYQIGDHDYYVRHEGKLWVLWDFEMMAKHGEPNPHPVDIGDPVSPTKNDLNQAIGRLTDLDGNVHDYFQKLVQLGIIKTSLGGSDEIVNAIPYTLKTDAEHPLPESFY